MDFLHGVFHILGIKKIKKENFSKSISPGGRELSF